MPIRPSERARYPKLWPEISNRIRFQRGKGQCECDGRCGSPHPNGRCLARHGHPHPLTGSTVVLTTAHLNHTPEDCRDENLRGMCQKCHLAYDREHHISGRRARQEAERSRVMEKAGQIRFALDCGLKP